MVADHTDRYVMVTVGAFGTVALLMLAVALLPLPAAVMLGVFVLIGLRAGQRTHLARHAGAQGHAGWRRPAACSPSS